MIYNEDVPTKLFKDTATKKYTPYSWYLGSKKAGGYSILEPSQKEIEIFNGYNDSAFIKINGESSQVTSNAGKNLLDPAKILTGYNTYGTDLTSNTIVSGSANNLVQSYLIKLTPSTSYRLRKEYEGTRFRGFYFEEYPIGTGAVSIGGAYRDAFTDMSISFPATAKWFFVVLTGDYEAKPTGNVQLEQGTSHTTFEAFVPNKPTPDYPSNINCPSNFDLITTNESGQTKTINFPYTLNRFTDGTTDYIEIDNINKTAKLYKFVGEFAFLDSMSYTLYTYNGLLGAFATVLPENYTRVAGVCTHENRVGAFYATSGTYMWIGVGSKQVFWIGILDALNITTVGEFKTWLGQQTANGNTVKGIYKLKTPTVTDLDYDEVTTYYPYTKIYTNATVQPTLDGKIRVQG